MTPAEKPRQRCADGYRRAEHDRMPAHRPRDLKRGLEEKVAVVLRRSIHDCGKTGVLAPWRKAATDRGLLR